MDLPVYNDNEYHLKTTGGLRERNMMKKKETGEISDMMSMKQKIRL